MPDASARACPHPPATTSSELRAAGARRLIQAAQFAAQWRDRDRFTVFDADFGVGHRFLACVDAWRTSARRPGRLAYVAVAPSLPTAQQLECALAAAAPDDGPIARALIAQWPLPLPGVHVIECADSAVSLVLVVAQASAALARVRCAVDAFLIDADDALDAMGGHASGRGARGLDAMPLKRLARLARPAATVVLRTQACPPTLPASRLADDLERAGFRMRAMDTTTGGCDGTPPPCDATPILVGTYAPAWATFEPPAPDPVWPARRAIVIGAGVGGCAITASLARRGWDVTVFDRAASICAEGSAQPMVADHLHLSPDDNHLARLSRNALMSALRDPCRAATSIGVSGRLALADDAKSFEQQRVMLDRLDLPAEYACLLDAEAASDRAGVRLRTGGIWLPLCRNVDPRMRCREWLDAHAARTEVRLGVAVARIARCDGLWTLFDTRGGVLDAAPVLVLAAAGSVPMLGGLSAVDLRRVRGQTTRLARAALPGLRAVLGADAYACPLPDGDVLVGSTFDDGDDLEPDPQADLSNLRRLARATGTAVDEYLPHARSAASGFRFTAPDRLPLIGPVPDSTAIVARAADFARNDRLALPMLPGLYAASAFGSRGMLWSSLAAEVLAADIDGGPASLESDLLDAIAPVRFLRKRLRRHAG